MPLTTPAGATASVPPDCVPLSFTPTLVTGTNIPPIVRISPSDSEIGTQAPVRTVTSQAVLVASSIANNSRTQFGPVVATTSPTVVVTHPLLMSTSQPTTLISLAPALLSTSSPVREIRPKPAPSESVRLTVPMTENASLSQPPPPPLIAQLPVTSSVADDMNNTGTPPVGDKSATLPSLTPVSGSSNAPPPDRETGSGRTGLPADAKDVKFEIIENLIEGQTADVLAPVSVGFDPQPLMDWGTGVATLTDSHLKFQTNENGGLHVAHGERDIKIQTASPEKTLTNGSNDCASQSSDEADRRTCINCGKVGVVQNFIRAGKFCSTTCVSSHAAHIKSLVLSRETDASVESHCKPAIKPEAKNKQTGRVSPMSEKRKQHVSTGDATLAKARKSLEDENDENNRVNNSNHRRHEPLVTGKMRGGRFGRKNRVKELRVEETNSCHDSEKMSLPSSPSSSLVQITPQSALHQSIFSMRVLQHQQEPPLGWDRHSKNLHPVLHGVRLPDVLRWNPEKVAEFVNTIPGCRDVGQIFADELIDGEAFLLLNQQDIVKVLNIKLGPAVKIYNSVVLIRDAIEL